MLTTLIAQIIVIVAFMAYGSTREGALLLAASAIRIFEGHLGHKSSGFFALHTGMTTKHILVIVHRFSGLAQCVNLEDAAVPWRTAQTSRWEFWFRSAIKLSVWLQKGSPHPVSATRGYSGKRARRDLGRRLTVTRLDCTGHLRFYPGSSGSGVSVCELGVDWVHRKYTPRFRWVACLLSVDFDGVGPRIPTCSTETRGGGHCAALYPQASTRKSSGFGAERGAMMWIIEKSIGVLVSQYARAGQEQEN
ncbi:hypothetical protein C8J57DRAFT_1255856 [Mycena rebaudengoi]|nr:hypothetical protein C8J57DRAFT_1255856 [Mycena rebaudengoi]